MSGGGGRNTAKGVQSVLEGDDVREILRDTFFSTPPPPPVAAPSEPPAKAKGRGKPKPDHYKVICISMYTDDLARLDEAVRELKRRGFTKANRSAVLRAAMDQLDLGRVRKGL